jgi:hypothetical protein
MRTTLDIDDDVLKVAKDIAAAQKKTCGEVISELARAALQLRAEKLDVSKLEIRNGIPILPARGVATKELVDRLIEEADLEEGRFSLRQDK